MTIWADTVWIQRNSRRLALSAAIGCCALSSNYPAAGQQARAQPRQVEVKDGQPVTPPHTGSVTSPAPTSPPEQRHTTRIGSDLYPVIATPTDQPRFDSSSNLLVNTLGARTGLFGAAAREGITWANRYVPGTDMSGRVQLYALSTSGYYGAFFGARSSDNNSKNAENVIGAISLVVADSDRPHLHWARYSEGYVPRGKTAFRLLINDENSIQNEGSPAPWADPYDFNPQHLLNNLRVDCGIGIAGAQSCTNPLSVLNNGARYRTGILFGENSIDPVDGVATALALPADYGFAWFGAPRTQTWRMYSTARAAQAGSVVLADDAVSINVGQSKEAALRVESGAIRTPAVIASSNVPAMTGSCVVGEQQGGTTAGAFSFVKDCGEGKIVIGFSVAAPNGWACSASDLARGDAVLRETAYDKASATLAISRVRRGDRAVFSCTGF